MAKKAPPTRFPNAVVVGYSQSMKKLVREMGSGTLDIFDNQVAHHLKELRRFDALTERADGPLSFILNALIRLKEMANSVFGSYKITQIVVNSIQLLDRASQKNAAAQARVFGVNPLTNNETLSDFMDASVQENVSFITKLKDDYLTEVERVILQGAKKGSTLKEIRDQLVARTGMTLKRAEFIATDQLGTIFGQLTAKRHQDMGVDKFTWSTSGDERVRDTHAELDGKVFSYTDPPTVNGRKVLPGEDFRCRCVAEPVFDD